MGDGLISPLSALLHTGDSSQTRRSPVKRNQLALLLTIAIAAASVAGNPASAAGRSASSIPNTILNGKGAPANNIGNQWRFLY